MRLGQRYNSLVLARVPISPRRGHYHGPGRLEPNGLHTTVGPLKPCEARVSIVIGLRLRLAASVELREKLGVAARETMKRYTWERAACQLEALYLHVLALEGRTRA